MAQNGINWSSPEACRIFFSLFLWECYSFALKLVKKMAAVRRRFKFAAKMSLFYKFDGKKSCFFSIFWDNLCNFWPWITQLICWLMLGTLVGQQNGILTEINTNDQNTHLFRFLAPCLHKFTVLGLYINARVTNLTKYDVYVSNLW